MVYYFLSPNFITNFKKNCKSKSVSDNDILSLFANIEMSNKKVDELKVIIKEHRPNIYNHID